MVPMLGFAMPGIGELLVVALIAFLLFGKRLPGQIKGVMQSLREFRKGLSEVETDVEEA